jgi:hypothetical protein
VTGNVSSVLHNRLCVFYTFHMTAVDSALQYRLCVFYTFHMTAVDSALQYRLCVLYTFHLTTVDKDMPLILCTLQLHKHLYICNIYPNCMVDCRGHISRVKGPHIRQMGSCGHWLSTTGTCLCPQWTSGKHTQKNVWSIILILNSMWYGDQPL